MSNKTTLDFSSEGQNKVNQGPPNQYNVLDKTSASFISKYPNPLLSDLENSLWEEFHELEQPELKVEQISALQAQSSENRQQENLQTQEEFAHEAYNVKVSEQNSQDTQSYDASITEATLKDVYEKYLALRSNYENNATYIERIIKAKQSIDLENSELSTILSELTITLPEQLTQLQYTLEEITGVINKNTDIDSTITYRTVHNSLFNVLGSLKNELLHSRNTLNTYLINEKQGNIIQKIDKKLATISFKLKAFHDQKNILTNVDDFINYYPELEEGFFDLVSRLATIKKNVAAINDSYITDYFEKKSSKITSALTEQQNAMALRSAAITSNGLKQEESKKDILEQLAKQKTFWKDLQTELSSLIDETSNLIENFKKPESRENQDAKKIAAELSAILSKLQNADDRTIALTINDFKVKSFSNEDKFDTWQQKYLDKIKTNKDKLHEQLQLKEGIKAQLLTAQDKLAVLSKQAKAKKAKIQKKLTKFRKSWKEFKQDQSNLIETVNKFNFVFNNQSSLTNENNRYVDVRNAISKLKRDLFQLNKTIDNFDARLDENTTRATINIDEFEKLQNEQTSLREQFNLIQSKLAQLNSAAANERPNEDKTNKIEAQISTDPDTLSTLKELQQDLIENIESFLNDCNNTDNTIRENKQIQASIQSLQSSLSSLNLSTAAKQQSNLIHSREMLVIIEATLINAVNLLNKLKRTAETIDETQPDMLKQGNQLNTNLELQELDPFFSAQATFTQPATLPQQQTVTSAIAHQKIEHNELVNTTASKSVKKSYTLIHDQIQNTANARTINDIPGEHKLKVVKSADHIMRDINEQRQSKGIWGRLKDFILGILSPKITKEKKAAFVKLEIDLHNASDNTKAPKAATTVINAWEKEHEHILKKQRGFNLFSKRKKSTRSSNAVKQVKGPSSLILFSYDTKKIKSEDVYIEQKPRPKH